MPFAFGGQGGSLRENAILFNTISLQSESGKGICPNADYLPDDGRNGRRNEEQQLKVNSNLMCNTLQKS